MAVLCPHGLVRLSPGASGPCTGSVPSRLTILSSKRGLFAYENPRGRNGGRNAKDILGANGVPGDFDDRDGLNRVSGSPDLRSGLSGLHEHSPLGGQLLRMPLHVAGSVQRVGVGPRRPVRHQSIFCEWATARGPTISPRLTKHREMKGPTCSGTRAACGASAHLEG